MRRYEIHLTVAAASEALPALAAARGMKYTHIQLDRGDHASQPMLSLLVAGTPASAEAEARRTAAELQAAGFPVARLKVEAAASEAGTLPGLYFEHHVKLSLPEETDLDAVRGLAVQHDAHLSRNARRVRVDGVRERFVTQRCHHADRPRAAAALAGLLDALTAAGWEVAEVEEEWVLVDDNPGLDAGWFG
ncbi:hypothetical protein ACTI_41770 [Actinoplanes sp. OR16]|uniref:hypothetical protein n=1 Tax=Actinoplanes sp. OR16 TaxID=946334 RepID=UPI000F7063CC|nr:hypothetical protein [Actinoplanes sp. OR16]BBH67492.1 hypothetical protein ACTI_41770 [Actinoplanes sp. OR16]